MGQLVMLAQEGGGAEGCGDGSGDGQADQVIGAGWRDWAAGPVSPLRRGG